LKTKLALEITRDWTDIHECLGARDNAPIMYILDNEALHDLKEALKKYELTYQLAPPHIHGQNATERVIYTFKNHLLAILASSSLAESRKDSTKWASGGPTDEGPLQRVVSRNYPL
jgi:hypothetical protein